MQVNERSGYRPEPYLFSTVKAVPSDQAAHHWRTIGMTASRTRTADLNARHSAIALAVAIPGDAVLYQQLPMYAAQFGVTLAQAGVLLAANRLVRIAEYSWVARYYARRGDRPTDSLAVAAAAVPAANSASVATNHSP